MIGGLIWVEPTSLSASRHRRARHAIRRFLRAPPAVYLLALIAALLAATLYLAVRDWTKRGWDALDPFIAVMLLLAIAAFAALMWYCLVAYGDRLVVLRSTGVFINGTWYPSRKIRDAQIRRFHFGSRFLCIRGRSQRCVAGIPPAILDLEVYEALERRPDNR